MQTRGGAHELTFLDDSDEVAEMAEIHVSVQEIVSFGKCSLTYTANRPIVEMAFDDHDAANVPKGVAMTTQTSRLHRTITSVRRVWDDLDRGSQAIFRF